MHRNDMISTSSPIATAPGLSKATLGVAILERAPNDANRAASGSPLLISSTSRSSPSRRSRPRWRILRRRGFTAVADRRSYVAIDQLRDGLHCAEVVGQQLLLIDDYAVVLLDEL